MGLGVSISNGAGTAGVRSSGDIGAGGRGAVGQTSTTIFPIWAFDSI